MFRLSQIVRIFKNEHDDTITQILNLIDVSCSIEILTILRHSFSEILELEKKLNLVLYDKINKIKKKNLIINLTTKQEKEFFDTLESNLYGHNIFKENLKTKIKEFIFFNKLGEQKILSIFLLGSSGVGKTEVARIFHSFLTEGKNLAKVSFGNYSSQDSLNSLIGSPRGYTGSETGELVKRISESDTGIILIDEFEKSNEKVTFFFLELLEEGKFSSSQGINIELNGYVIIFTSNLSPKDFEEKLPPEFQNRLDMTSNFNSLSNETKKEYYNNEIIKFVRKITKNPNLDFLSEEFSSIDVSKYNNLRDINKEIRRIIYDKYGKN